MGALNTYRDHVVHLAAGMEDYEGFVPFFDEEEGDGEGNIPLHVPGPRPLR